VPAAAAIDDDQSPGISQDLDARRASTVSQDLWAAFRYRSACAPEAHLHWWILGKICRFGISAQGLIRCDGGHAVGSNAGLILQRDAAAAGDAWSR
jgi:hypothetical protein